MDQTVLGRGVVVERGQPVPEPWVGEPEVLIDEAALADPAATVDALHRAWSTRTPVVVRLTVDPASFREPVSLAAEPFTLEPDLELWADRLHALVWANTYDARSGDPVWWWARKAERLGARLGGPADVVLADGTPAWVDGGPREPLATEHAVVHRETVEAGRLSPLPAPKPPRAELAPDQLDAVAHRSGSARVLAPAGSGKTRVLTERLRHLLVDRGDERDGVLAVAYNVKARDEMVERTTDVRARIQTLNGLGFWVLREALGDLRVLEERDVRRLVEALLPRRLPRRANTDPVAPYVEALGEVRLGLREPADVEDERDDVAGLADLVGPYRERLRSMGAVDFDEQVYRAVEVLLADGGLRRRLQARCRRLLVDEFQDLTPAHVLLVRLLAGPLGDVFGVGDDDQVIYGHAGADPRFLVAYEQFFPGAASHALEVNYRCPVAVVEAAGVLLQHNRRRVPKVILPGPDAAPGTDRLRVVLADPAGLAASTREAVEAHLRAGASPSDVAVLARVNSLLLAPLVALSEAGVPVASGLDATVLQRTGVRAALAYLRLAASPGRLGRDDLAEVYRRPSRGLPEWIQKWFRDGMSLDDLARVAERLDDAKVSDKVLDLAADLRLLASHAAGGSAAQGLLTLVRDDVGLGAAMEQLDRSKGREGTSQLDDLEALIEVAGLHPDPATLSSWLASVLRRAPAADGVTLATVHKVKGREWPHVVLFGVSEGIVPHRLSLDVEEERRVLHVGITRASASVTIVADRSRPSPFLPELSQPPSERPSTTAATRTITATTSPRLARAADAADPLFDALKAWRATRAKADGVPAYVVFHDATLRAIADARPAALPALARVRGLGPAKLERYGDEVLAVVAASG